jgi:uncharacterized protein YdhG (YjbR/CyaY superfamily)
MATPKKRFTTIDEYISTFPQEVQGILAELRETVRGAAPNAEEGISYQIPAFRLKGKYLVYFAAFRKHIGLYPPPPEAFKKEVASYEGPKGNLKFPIDKPIPLSLVERIVKHRAEEILEMAKGAANPSKG